MCRRLELSNLLIRCLIKYGGRPITRICRIYLVILLIVRNGKKMVGQAMRISPAKQVFTILMQFLCMKNGWLIIATNSKPMVFFPLSFLRVVGVMNGETDLTGQVPSRLSPGI